MAGRVVAVPSSSVSHGMPSSSGTPRTRIRHCCSQPYSVAVACMKPAVVGGNKVAVVDIVVRSKERLHIVGMSSLQDPPYCHYDNERLLKEEAAVCMEPEAKFLRRPLQRSYCELLLTMTSLLL